MPPQWLILVKLLPATFGYSLIALLIRRGLGRRYAAFLALIFVHATVWVVNDRIPPVYRIPVFIGATVSGWFFYTYVVCEVFSRMFGGYPGIARTGRKVITISMLVAISASFITADQEFGNNLSSAGVLVATIGERVVSAAIVVYLTLILLFLRWMPVPLPANVVRHTVIFFCYFVFTALVLHFWNRVAEQQDREMVNALIAFASTIAYAAWAWLLRPEGEHATQTRTAPTANAARILNQLETINRALGRGMAGH